MHKLATFTPDVAKAMFDFTRQNPRNAKAELAESVWDFGFTKDSPRQIFSLSKMFLSCQHVTTGQNVYCGFTIEPGDEPLKFIVKQWTRVGDEKVTQGFKEVEHIARIQDVPAVIRNAARKAHEQAMAMHLERIAEQREHLTRGVR